jgi:hypothetical protein
MANQAYRPPFRLAQPLQPGFKGFLAALGQHCNHAMAFQVSQYHRKVLVSLAQRNLIDPQTAYYYPALLFLRPFGPALEYRLHRLRVQSLLFRHRSLIRVLTLFVDVQFVRCALPTLAFDP